MSTSNSSSAPASNTMKNDEGSSSSSSSSTTAASSLVSRKAMAPFIAGLSGGTVSTVLLLPLDNIKVRLQVNEGIGNEASSATQHTRLGAIRMARGVLKHEGIRGLYQGLTPAVIGSAGSWGGFFYVYEAMKRQLMHFKQSQQKLDATNTATDTTIHLNSWENFQVATLSGVVMVFLTNPIWLIKLRMQLQMKRSSQELHANITQYDGFLDAVRKIVQQEGFWALYKGTGPALMLTSHGGVQFVCYEFLKKHFHFAQAQRKDVGSTSTQSVWERMESSIGYLSMGAISKMVASTATYPLQVMKSRMQQPASSIELTHAGDVRVVNRNYYTSVLATVSKIWQQEGIVGFFKGAIPNAVRVAPSAAVTFVVYETVMDMLKV